MDSHCERDEFGREVGVVRKDGNEFRALGASVIGTSVTGYLGKGDTLTTWCGRIMLACRSVRHGRWHDDNWGETFGIGFLLTKRRAIVGYCLGEGSLFRGKLVRFGPDEIDPLHEAIREECEYWLGVDQEDHERQAEEDAEEEAKEQHDWDCRS